MFWQCVEHRIAVVLLQRLYASQSGFAGYGDELAWAAANIYRATKEARYLRDARNFYGRVSFRVQGLHSAVLKALHCTEDLHALLNSERLAILRSRPACCCCRVCGYL